MGGGPHNSLQASDETINLGLARVTGAAEPNKTLTDFSQPFEDGGGVKIPIRYEQSVLRESFGNLG